MLHEASEDMVHAVLNVEQAHKNGYLVEMSVRNVVGYPSGLPRFMASFLINIAWSNIWGC